MALALNTKGGNLVIQDMVHAIDKDTRTLFALDNYKHGKKNTSNEIPELHLLSYYGDITGPNELKLRNECIKLIQPCLKTWQTHSKFKQYPSDSLLFCQTLFNKSTVEIMHISHYSFEFVINVTNIKFFQMITNKNNKNNKSKPHTKYTKSVNHYLVGTYQQSGYDNHIDEFVTIGITTSVSPSNDTQLYNFYVDDFLQDLYQILHNTSWYDNTCDLPLLLWYHIAQYTMDCILPVKYKRSNEDEIVLNDGSLHVFLTGDLNPFISKNSKDKQKKIDDKLEIISQIFNNFGRIIHKEYSQHKNKIKSEYDKWKKQGFKKRAFIKPINIKDLSIKLRLHQQKRSRANDIESINSLKCLYYKNPNFKLKLNKKKYNTKHRKSKTTMQSFKNFFSFGKSKNKNKNIHSLHLITSQTDEVINDFVEIARSKTEPFDKPIKNIKKRNKKHKKNTNHRLQVSAEMKETNSLPTSKLTEIKSISKSKSMSRSKSSGYPNKNNKKSNNKMNYMTIGMLYNTNSYDTMDDDDNGLVLPDTNIKETQSADSVYMNIKRTTSGKLTPTMKKPNKVKSFDIISNNTNSPRSPYSPYSHDENVVRYIDYEHANANNNNSDQNVNVQKRRESATFIKIKNDIIKAYKDYIKDKGKIPDNVQSFLNYCKIRKNIKKANWTLCESVINQMENKVDKMNVVVE